MRSACLEEAAHIEEDLLAGQRHNFWRRRAPGIVLHLEHRQILTEPYIYRKYIKIVVLHCELLEERQLTKVLANRLQLILVDVQALQPCVIGERVRQVFELVLLQAKIREASQLLDFGWERKEAVVQLRQYLYFLYQERT